MAERMGFEPMKEFPLYTLSKRAPSTTRPPLQLISVLKYFYFNSKKFQCHSKYLVFFLNQKDKYLSARYAYNLCCS